MKKVYSPPTNSEGTPDGHKVFVDTAGQVYLADGSGSTPAQTEDGPLRVSNYHCGKGNENLISLCVNHGDLTAIIPVFCEREQRDANVWTTAATAIAVMRHIDIGIGYSPEVFQLVADLKTMNELAAGAAMTEKPTPAAWTPDMAGYLINLRYSGVTNMWGAAPYLKTAFGISLRDASACLLHWIGTFK